MRDPLVVRLSLCLVVVVALTTPSVSAQNPAGVSFTERNLATIPDDLKEPGPFHPGVSRPDHVSLSPGVSGFRFGQELFGSTVVFGAGGDGWSPVVSPDGSRVAYRAKRGKKELVVVGDQAGPPHDSVSLPVFSPDGSTVAYAATEGKRSFVMVGDRSGPDFDNVGRPVFSPDGRVVAYAAAEGKGAFVVLGDARGPEFADVSSPVFSPDGGRVAYVARREGKDAKAFVMVGDKEGPAFDKVGELTFRPDGVVAYTAGVGKAMSLVVGDERHPEFDFVAAPVFGRGTDSVAYAAARKTTSGCKWTIVLGGARQAEYEEVGPPVFAPDGRTLAYAAFSARSAGHGQQYFFVVGGEERRFKLKFGFPETPTPELLPRPFVAYGAADTQRSLVPSPDGTRWAYRADDRRSIVVGEKAGERFDEVGPPMFSPDGRRVGHMARKGRQIWWRVVDAS